MTPQEVSSKHVHSKKKRLVEAPSTGSVVAVAMEFFIFFRHYYLLSYQQIYPEPLHSG